MLEHALVAAFPATTIDRDMIDEPTALWLGYAKYPQLAELEGKTWLDVTDDWLWRNPMLLGFVGDTLWHAILPAYLRYLLREHDEWNSLPGHVAGWLTRKGDLVPRFDRRLALLSAAQRAAIRDVLVVLATKLRMEAAMSRALATWNQLQETPEHALVAAFPAIVIDRAMFDGSNVLWEYYDGVADLPSFEGKTWLELSADQLTRHSGLLIWVGERLWAALVPAYLRYLLQEPAELNDLPWHVASQLTRNAKNTKLDRRAALLSQPQRGAIREVLAQLASAPRFGNVMTTALETWNTVATADSRRDSY